MTDHNCHAIACKTRCKPEFLMCGRHWAKVPEVYKKLVWKHYRHGQCDDKEPSPEWHAAADLAIAAVALKEGLMGLQSYDLIKAKSEQILAVTP